MFSYKLAGITLALSMPLAAAFEMPKEKLLTGIEGNLPTAFCKEESFFRSCFSVPQKQCVKTATTAIRTCISNVRDGIPAVITTKEHAILIGKEAGECAGKLFAKTHESEIVMSEQCSAAFLAIVKTAK